MDSPFYAVQVTSKPQLVKPPTILELMGEDVSDLEPAALSELEAEAPSVRLELRTVSLTSLEKSSKKSSKGGHVPGVVLVHCKTSGGMEGVVCAVTATSPFARIELSVDAVGAQLWTTGGGVVSVTGAIKLEEEDEEDEAAFARNAGLMDMSGEEDEEDSDVEMDNMRDMEMPGSDEEAAMHAQMMKAARGASQESSGEDESSSSDEEEEMSEQQLRAQLRKQMQAEEAAAAAEAAKSKKRKRKEEAAQKQKQGEASPDTRTEGKAKKAKKDKKPKLVQLQGGLQYKDIKVGSGKPAKAGRRVSVRYRGLLKSGKEFDGNLPRGRPFKFKLGAGQVIAGWDQGVVGMKVGGVRHLVIPAHLAYGRAGSPPTIPPNSTLLFEVHLLSA